MTKRYYIRCSGLLFRWFLFHASGLTITARIKSMPPTITASIITSIASLIVAFLTTLVTIKSSKHDIFETQTKVSEVSKQVENITIIPIGTIIPYAGSTDLPSRDKLKEKGWLLCNGDEVNRDKYKALFEVIQKNFGHGKGEGSFYLPDLREKFPLGVKDDEDGKKYPLGNTDGKMNHTHVISHIHQITGHTSADGEHKHLLLFRDNAIWKSADNNDLFIGVVTT